MTDATPALGDARLARLVEYIAATQREDGLVPTTPGGTADPWDHVESAMGLTVGGRHDAAERAYEWVADVQHDDGGLWATYDEGVPERDHRETHHAAYVAVGVWHHYRVTGDRAFLEDLWPTVEAALEFARTYQASTGEVFWAVGADGEVYEDALVAGSSSVYKSFECGAAIAGLLGESAARDRWLAARDRVGEAVRTRGERFDRTWESKSRFAMDWFYPILCGVVSGSAARKRLATGTERFVEAEMGCRCVSDEPWVTVAESCELVMALAASGQRTRAREVFDWLFRFTDDDGVFWTGYQFEDDEFWPGERPTWTSGAALLAADTLFDLTPASGLFTTPVRHRQPADD